MVSASLGGVVRHLRQLESAVLNDRRLLERYICGRDEAAFEAILHRHGSLVWGVCRRALPDANDAEDAFQATFLVLLRKARAVRVQESLAGWLHGVAYRIARKVRADAIQRRSREARCDGRRESGGRDELVWKDLRRILDEELDRLPAKYREPLVLCYLEGKTYTEAARQLGWAEGTVCGRLARAREKLRGRLIRRGVGLGTTGLAVLTSETAPAAVVAATLKMAAVFELGEGAALTWPAVRLATEALQGMTMSRIKTGAALFVLLTVLATGAGMAVRNGTGQSPEAAHQSTSQNRSPGHSERGLQDFNDGPLPAGAMIRLGSSRLRQGEGVAQVAYAPDGKLLASVGGGSSETERVIKLWNAASGKFLRELRGHASFWIGNIDFSPDGKLLVSSGADRTVRIWDVGKGQQVQLIRPHRYGGYGAVASVCAAFTADGSKVVSGSFEGVVQVWDVATGRELLKLMTEVRPRAPLGDNHWVSTLAVSPDGKRVATAIIDKKIVVWDLLAKRVAAELAIDTPVARDLKFLADGKTLAWCDSSHSEEQRDGGIYCWDLETGNRRVEGLDNKGKAIHCLSFSVDGKQLATSGDGNAIELWDMRARKLRQTFSGHTDPPSTIAFAPDGKTIASGSGDGSIRIWDVATGKERLPNPSGHWDEVRGLAVAPDGKTAVLASRDRTVRVCELASGRLLRRFGLGGAEIQGIAFSQDGAALAVARGVFVELWDVASGQKRWSGSEFRMFKNDVQLKSPATEALTFSPDGRQLASLTCDQNDSWRRQNTIRIWDTATGNLLVQIDRPFRAGDAPAWSPDGKQLYMYEEKIEQGGRGGKPMFPQVAVRSFESLTGRLVSETKASDLAGNSMAMSPDSKLLAIGTSFNRMYFLDRASGKLQFSLQGPRLGVVFTTLVFAPDSSRVAGLSSRDPCVIQIWDMASGELTHQFPLLATALAFTRDSKRLVVGQKDGTALVWNLDGPGVRLPPRKAMTRKEIEERWLALASGYSASTGNAGSSARADALVEAGDEAVAYLEEQLLDPSLPERDREWARRLTAPLGGDDRQARAWAVQEVEKLGDNAWKVVQGLVEEPASLERLKTVESVLLRNLEYRRNGSLDVLRQIATPRACRLLGQLAEGPADTPENKERKQMADWTLKGVEKLKLRQPK